MNITPCTASRATFGALPSNKPSISEDVSTEDTSVSMLLTIESVTSVPFMSRPHSPIDTGPFSFMILSALWAP